MSLEQLIKQAIVKHGLQETIEAIANYCEEVVSKDVENGADTVLGQQLRSYFATASAGAHHLSEQLKQLKDE